MASTTAKKENLENGTLKITTFYKRNDNGKKAVMYKTYLFNKDTFVITKEVKYKNSKEKFLRNKQKYIRL